MFRLSRSDIKGSFIFSEIHQTIFNLYIQRLINYALKTFWKVDQNILKEK